MMTTLRAVDRPDFSGTTWVETVLAVGLTLYAAAWFVPVVAGGATLSNGHLPGWQALVFAWNGSDPARAGLRMLQRSSALSNLLVVGVPIALLRPTRTLLLAVSGALLIAFVSNLQWLALLWPGSGLRIGYYAWCASFGVLSVAMLMKAPPGAQP